MALLMLQNFAHHPTLMKDLKMLYIDLIVIHAISLPAGSYDTQLVKDLFLNCLDPGKDEFLEIN